MKRTKEDWLFLIEDQQQSGLTWLNIAGSTQLVSVVSIMHALDLDSPSRMTIVQRNWVTTLELKLLLKLLMKALSTVWTIRL